MQEVPRAQSQLEEKIGYTFSRPELLQRALTHPSYGREKRIRTNNQRLEFLGDAVLGLIIADLLFELFPGEREGYLTRQRSILVKGQQLHAIAVEIELGTYLFLGEGEALSGGRQRASILEDAFEALIGAVYLDGGFSTTHAIVEKLYGSIEKRLEELSVEHNPKGQLQELLQPNIGNQSLDYRVTEAAGPDHEKTFSVELWIEGKLRGTGEGRSKQAAESMAAKEALREFEK
jgi:ribonuclease-3